jgi:hypothetical protein
LPLLGSVVSIQLTELFSHYLAVSYGFQLIRSTLNGNQD